MDTGLLELRERVLEARQQRRPLRLCGSGTKDFYGERLEGEPLSLRAYQGIVDYDPSELVITARCGTPLSQIEAVLADSGQFLGFEPPAFGGDPTLGGVVAAGLSGPRRMQAGAVRDFVLGAHLLAADGEVLRFGGQVMKNVAGFDVSRLLCGSLGIFGVLTQLSLKVLPRPRAERTQRLAMSAQEAIVTFNRLGGRPLPVSAAAWCDGQAWLRFSGARSAVGAACSAVGGERVDDNEAAAWWSSLRHCTHPVLADSSLWRLSMPSTAPCDTLAVPSLIDWGGALRWYACDGSHTRMRELAGAAGGTAMKWRGAAPAGRFHPLAPAVLALHRRLKQHFDPDGLFNPGRLLAAL
ncbi:MAG TPA: glycolate oxidase subunit GlcE [Steroidobacteraceae bacterium]|nr:glycolate oxidase subunit GlcE [Steroidobacteraceae bacterium]